jgi:hypothetical protein
MCSDKMSRRGRERSGSNHSQRGISSNGGRRREGVGYQYRVMETGGGKCREAMGDCGARALSR